MSYKNNGQAGIGFLINRKWKDHIWHHPQSSRTWSVHMKGYQLNQDSWIQKLMHQQQYTQKNSLTNRVRRNMQDYKKESERGIMK